MRKYKRIKPKKKGCNPFKPGQRGCTPQSKRRVNKSIYKSNINKQNVKVNVMGATPSAGSISHMHIPYPVPFSGSIPSNFTDLNTSLKSLENVIKQNQQEQQTQSQTQAQPKPKKQLYNLEAKNQNVNALSQFVKNTYPEKKYEYEETKTDKEDMAHDILDDLIDNALNYNQCTIDKLKIYDKKPEVINSDDYDATITLSN